MTNIQTLVKTYSSSQPRSAEETERLRASAREASVRATSKFISRILGFALLVGGGSLAYDAFTGPDSRTVKARVLPHDNPTTLVQRMEDKFGEHPGELDVAKEAWQIQQQYGTLQPGQIIPVEVK